MAPFHFLLLESYLRLSLKMKEDHFAEIRKTDNNNNNNNTVKYNCKSLLNCQLLEKGIKYLLQLK